MPSLIDYRSDDQTIVMVEIANNGSTPLIIQPNALLCQLQKVDVCTNNDSQNDLLTTIHIDKTESDFLASFKIDGTKLNDEQKKQVQELLLDYRDIFSKNVFDIGLAPKVKHEIRLTNDTLISNGIIEYLQRFTRRCDNTCNISSSVVLLNALVVHGHRP